MESLSSSKISKKKFGKASFKLVPPNANDKVEELEKDLKTDDLYANRGKFDHLVKLLDKDIGSIKASKSSVN